MVSTSLVAGLITLAQGRVSAGATAKVAKGAEKAKADSASALDQVKAQARTDRKTRIGDAKDQARARVQRLIEQMKLLKKLYADDPKKMAKALAEAAKELQGAVKDYAAAAKDSGEMFADDFKSLPDAAANPDAAASARKTLEDEAKAEAAGDMDFIKLVRGLGADLKDLLLTARTKATLTMKERFEETDDYKDAEKGLKDLGKSVDDLDQQVRSDMPPGSLLTLAA